MEVFKPFTIFLLLWLAIHATDRDTSKRILRPIDPTSDIVRPSKRVKTYDKDITAVSEQLVKLTLGKEEHRFPVDALLGHGGPYKVLRKISTFNTIDSDHAPHYSSLEYFNTEPHLLDKLPAKIRDVVVQRKQLVDDLKGKPEYMKNEQDLGLVSEKINNLAASLKQQMSNELWTRPHQLTYSSNNEKMVNLIKSTYNLEEKLKSKKKNKPSDASLLSAIAENKRGIAELISANSALKPNSQVTTSLHELEWERVRHEKTKMQFEAKLRSFNRHIKDAMGTLTIPHEMHLLYPSTGENGLTDEILALKTADTDTSRVVKEKYHNEWVEKMQIGIDKGYFPDADNSVQRSANGQFVIDPTTGRKKYDYHKLWEDNFDAILYLKTEAKSQKTNPGSDVSPGGKDKKLSVAAQKIIGKYDAVRRKNAAEFMDGLHGSYAKKFMTTAIHHIKTPESGYAQLMSLFISEYKLYFRGDFDGYKMGIQKLLESNKQFGWINDEDTTNLRVKHDLDTIPVDTSAEGLRKAGQWKEVEDMKQSMVKRTRVGVPKPKGSKVVCPPKATRRRRSVAANAGGCIISVKLTDDQEKVTSDKYKPYIGPNKHIAEHDPNTKIGDIDVDGNPRNIIGPDVEAKTEHGRNRQTEIDVHELGPDGFPRSQVKLPSDADTLSINSRQLNTYLSHLDDADFDSVKAKESILDYTVRNSDKLAGSPEDISKTKALLEHEKLITHSQQHDLARQVLRNEGGITPKALSRYEKVKVSTSQFAAKISKYTSATGKASSAYGTIMLAKGVITAMRHGDYESLALMGGRIGLEVALGGVTKLGKRIAAKATTKFMTKLGSEVLAEVAGPIGAVADIGISVYSITKSVKVLNDPNSSKYEQNNAIADIVADSIDIAITATAAVLSLAFPPFAPIFAAVAFVVNVITTLAVALYKAANHVDELNAKIPLLDYERTTEYWRSFVGKETSGYIRDLVAVKNANNIAVRMTIDFLEKNSDYIGRVFPARTFYDPEAECSLEKKTCHKLVHLITTSCSDWEHLSDCNSDSGHCQGEYRDWKCQSDPGGDAPGSDGLPLAVNLIFPITNIAGHDDIDYRCQCGPDPPPTWGYEIRDSVVDLKGKQQVYLQRAAPDEQVPSGYEFLCKPSSISNEGDRVSRRYTNYEYLCKGAIGIRRGRGKFMLYDLGTGNDRVRLDEEEDEDNLFVVKNGVKTYLGNGGDDTFTFTSPCDKVRGEIDGKGWRALGNSLVLGRDCSRGDTIKVDLRSNRLSSDGGYDINLYNIQRVLGRADETDKIVANCATKLVVGGGGSSSSDPDVITTPSCGSGSSQLIVAIEGDTVLDAGLHFSGNLFAVVKGQPSFHASVPLQFDGVLRFKFEDSGSLTGASIDRKISKLKLTFTGGGSSTFDFVGYKSHLSQIMSNGSCEAPGQENSPISIELIDDNKFSRQLVYDLRQEQVQCVHRMGGGHGGGSVSGYDFLGNVFYLQSGSWTVSGGGLANQFNLNSFDFSGSLNGASGQSSVHFGNELTEPLEIDFDKGLIRGRGGSVNIRNINRVAFRPSYSERVITSCAIPYLDLGGGALDQVEIPAISCSNELIIAVKGKVSIVDKKRNGTTKIQAGYTSKIDHCSKTSVLRLELSISNNGAGHMYLLLNFPVHKLSSASLQILQIAGGNKVILSGEFPQVSFEEDSDLKSFLVKEGQELFSYHEISNSGNCHKTRKGSNVTPNLFKLVLGSSWTVTGGVYDDTFSLESDKFQGELDGGQGRNSLVISEGLHGDVSVSPDQVSVNGVRSVSFQNVATLQGRSGQPERVTVGCSSHNVQMNGGKDAQNMDTVTIPKMPCIPKMSIVATGYTDVSSSAESGSFDIYVQPSPSDHLTFKSNIFVGPSTKFNFAIQYPALRLRSYELNIVNDGGFQVVQLKIFLTGNNDNSVTFNHKYEQGQLQNANMMFVDDEFNSNGNILVNMATGELNILHLVQDNLAKSIGQRRTRRGATGAKNIFRLHSGNWEAFGGTLDDSFIFNEAFFQGEINGLGGVNSLILADSLPAHKIVITLPNKTLTVDNNASTGIQLSNIQIVNGRKIKQDEVICACDTKLVMLEGGASSDKLDRIEIKESVCQPEISFVLEEYTQVENKAKKGKFTYHVKTNTNFDIRYIPTIQTDHSFRFEIPLDQVEYITLKDRQLLINFTNSETKPFPLVPQKLPTFHFGNKPDLVAQLIFNESSAAATTLECSILAKSPFSGSIHGINGQPNGIVVQTEGIIQSILGGDKDDTIFLSQVPSIALIEGKGGINRLQFSEELHLDKQLEINFLQRNISFLENSQEFVRSLQGITMFTGREGSFERVILGCDTIHLKFVDEILVKANCSYNVRIEVLPATRIRFDIPEGEQELDDEDDDQSDEIWTEGVTEEDDQEWNDDDEDDEEMDGAFMKKLPQPLPPSIFFYHFSSLHSFDIEVDTFSKLRLTRHVFYFSFTLSDLKSIRFSSNDSRLIYSAHEQTQLEYSHLVAEADDFSMFYSQPEFFTAEGFLLRVTRYGEIVAVIANPQETLEVSHITQDIIPRLAAYASTLGISFMLTTASDFIYCGNPKEISLLTNRETVPSHLVGFNGTTYEILGLDKDVFIYPQLVEEGGYQVLDLTNIVWQIRNATKTKYIPATEQVGNDLEIRMVNWTEVFPGTVVIVNGALNTTNIGLLLNSVVMELIPDYAVDEPAPNRSKRSIAKNEEDIQTSWSIKPRPITIPEGNVYLLAAEDMEDGLEVRKGVDNKNATFEYSREKNDLIMMSKANEDSERGEFTSFILFDYFSPPPPVPDSECIRNDTDMSELDDDASCLKNVSEPSPFGRVHTVNNIQVQAGSQLVTVNSYEPLLFAETGEEVIIEFYEDVLDREEQLILKDFPDIPRKFEVPLWRKIGRTPMYKYAAWGVILFSTLLVAFLIWTFGRKESVKKKYKDKDSPNCNKEEELISLHEFGDGESEPILVTRAPPFLTPPTQIKNRVVKYMDIKN